MPNGVSLLHGDLTSMIIGVFQQVVFELGPAFQEVVYERAMAVLLRDFGLEAERQARILIHFRDNIAGDYRADLLVERLVIVELKVARAIDPAHMTQLLNLLNASTVEVGLLLRVGTKAACKRLILTNDRKPHLVSTRGAGTAEDPRDSARGEFGGGEARAPR